MKPGLTLREALDALELDTSISWGVPVSLEVLTSIVKLVCSCCLLAADEEPGIIEPEVLKRHEEKWAKTKDLKYAEKARKRGKFGWSIGKHLQVSPHYRSAHWAIRWTGPGRKIPKLRPIKGAWIHKSKVKELPTGFEDE